MMTGPVLSTWWKIKQTEQYSFYRVTKQGDPKFVLTSKQRLLFSKEESGSQMSACEKVTNLKRS